MATSRFMVGTKMGASVNRYRISSKGLFDVSGRTHQKYTALVKLQTCLYTVSGFIDFYEKRMLVLQ